MQKTATKMIPLGSWLHSRLQALPFKPRVLDRKARPESQRGRKNVFNDKTSLKKTFQIPSFYMELHVSYVSYTIWQK